MPRTVAPDPREYRLYLFADYADPEGEPLPNSMLHVVRETVNGNKVCACEPARERLITYKMNYWSFPLLDFLIVHAPICFTCKTKLIERGVIVDTSEAQQTP